MWQQLPAVEHGGVEQGLEDAARAARSLYDIYGETIRFVTRLNAAYLGRYYLPSVSVEAMYDATKNARSKGQWVQVVSRSR